MIHKKDAITALCPSAGFSLSPNGEIIDWHNAEITKPTESEIQAKITELTDAEPMRQLRIKRNHLLQQSDWMAVADRVMTQAQIDFRQALRDLPANSTPALDDNRQLIGVNWPTPPND